MDSFHCFNAPCPTKKPSLEPSVPDISLVIGAPNSYNYWKNNFYNKEKDTAPAIKKQVRFNNSVDQKTKMCQISNTTLEDEPTLTTTEILKNKQFQEVYMQNIPNRHLDLSLILQHNTENKVDHETVSKQISCENKSPPTQKIPTTYREFLEMQNEAKMKNADTAERDQCITDIFNYSSFKNRHINNLPKNHNKKSYVFETVPNSKDCHLKTIPKHGKINYNDSITPYNFTSQDHGKKLPCMNNETNFVKDTIRPHDVNIVKRTNDTSIQTSFIEHADGLEKRVEKSSNQSEEPTVKDLLKIIQQQNEQLIQLQKQVSSLLDGTKQIEAPPQPMNITKNEFNSNRDYQEIFNSGSTPRKGPLPKFSIDLMTSFEVSFRPQQNMYQRKPRDFKSQEPKIWEITENEGHPEQEENTKKVNDTSLHLQEPIIVRENCPSPEPSIQINMKDYESSDEDDFDSNSNIGATFYKNLMNQINKVISNSQKQSNKDNFPSRTEDLRDETMTKVRNATIKHLRRIGMQFSTIDEVSNSNTSNETPTSEQISFAVKQILMKYLPDDQLAKLSSERFEPKKSNKDKIILNSRAPDFSFATVQFMKKYDLISNDSKEIHGKTSSPDKAARQKIHRRVADNNPKILDISALKQQPKLL